MVNQYTKELTKSKDEPKNPVGRPKYETRKIPTAALPDIMLMKAQGKTLSQIQEWINETHHVFVNVSTISRTCKYSTKMDRTLTQAIYARATARGAEGFVNTLVNNMDQIHKVADRLLADENFAEWRLTKKLEADYLRLHMDLFGQTKTETSDDIGDIDQILSQIGGAKVNGTFDAEFEESLEQDSEQAFQLATQDKLPEVVELEHAAVIDEVEDLPEGRTEEWKQQFWGDSA